MALFTSEPTHSLAALLAEDAQAEHFLHKLLSSRQSNLATKLPVYRLLAQCNSWEHVFVH